MKNTDYNGWKNRPTWNVSLWISHESLYYVGVDYIRQKKERYPDFTDYYQAFIRDMGMKNSRTPDNIAWLAKCLDYEALNRMMGDLYRVRRDKYKVRGDKSRLLHRQINKGV